MNDDGEVLDFKQRNSHLTDFLFKGDKEAPQSDEDLEEESRCAAFGFLRGVRDRALALELRFQNGNTEFFPYSWLGPWQYNPSAGLLLKFTGDVVSLVLIRGSNLDATVNQGAVSLPHGFQRHRITFVREMDEAETRKIGEAGPTIDGIEVADFESQEELQAWLSKTAPLFVRKTRS